MEKVNITLRLPKDLFDFIEKKKEEMSKIDKLKSKVSTQSVIESIIAYWKEVDEFKNKKI